MPSPLANELDAAATIGWLKRAKRGEQPLSPFAFRLRDLFVASGSPHRTLFLVVSESLRKGSCFWQQILLDIRLRENLRDRRLRENLRLRRKRRALDVHFLIPVHTGSGRNEVTDDDVLLEAHELVPRTANRGVGQNTRRLLEARRRDERLRRETGLGDSEKQRLGHRRRFLLLLRPLVGVAEVLLVHVLA